MDVSSSTATGPSSRDEVDAGTAGEGASSSSLLLHTTSLLPVLAECWVGLKGCLPYTAPVTLRHLLCGKCCVFTSI